MRARVPVRRRHSFRFPVFPVSGFSGFRFFRFPVFTVSGFSGFYSFRFSVVFFGAAFVVAGAVFGAVFRFMYVYL